MRSGGAAFAAILRPTQAPAFQMRLGPSGRQRLPQLAVARLATTKEAPNECPSNLMNLESLAIERTCEEVQKLTGSLRGAPSGILSL